ncbi:putative monoglyceride lipase [Leptomonas pyrrhocoris]|uniref:Putative monoglyceride lipase n=1 Tax=Leptomonas pyrrhocoris TaxID=157538 RepID=A0A0M9FZA7_LEPPY|nr:putative monoglyceride lipase [Leptomonas pyrrhocoris]KPA78936.1 putative monoglyceride lipase [Leptomonas pyrrhocoris]|eukprot:XP_015657375.1 putative monoglyceride lipase [Leptomonas pyrrhocoris]
MLSLFSAAHGLPYAVAGRRPPDPELFPNYMQNAQNLWLRFTEWWPHGDGRPATHPAALKGVVFVVPGLGEHTGRYDSVALRLNREGYVAFSMDNQGAGGSEGERLYVERFEYFVDDVCAFVRFVQQRYPALKGLPTFLLGHSMGGLISVRVAQRDPSPFRGVVLSGPALSLTNPPPSFVLPLGSFFAQWVPKLPIFSVDVSLISHNLPVFQFAMQDPFYARVKLTARFTAEMLREQERAASDIDKSTFPFLIVHGEDDQLCSLSKSKWFHEHAPSKDKHLVSYAGAAHEVLTEVCRNDVMNDVVKFINERAT